MFYERKQGHTGRELILRLRAAGPLPAQVLLTWSTFTTQLLALHQQFPCASRTNTARLPPSLEGSFHACFYPLGSVNWPVPQDGSGAVNRHPDVFPHFSVTCLHAQILKEQVRTSPQRSWSLTAGLWELCIQEQQKPHVIFSTKDQRKNSSSQRKAGFLISLKGISIKIKNQNSHLALAIYGACGTLLPLEHNNVKNELCNCTNISVLQTLCWWSHWNHLYLNLSRALSFVEGKTWKWNLSCF